MCFIVSLGYRYIVGGKRENLLVVFFLFGRFGGFFFYIYEIKEEIRMIMLLDGGGRVLRGF